MNKSSVCVALLAVLLALCACSGGDNRLPSEPGGASRTVPLNQEYELHVGESVRLEGSPRVDVTLVRVFSDSRCAIDVLCPVAGTVDLELLVNRNQVEASSDIVRFTGTGGPQDTARLLGYRFAVQRVLPARRQGQQIPQEEYRAVLISSVDR